MPGWIDWQGHGPYFWGSLRMFAVALALDTWWALHGGSASLDEETDA